ncbi:MAG: hypothetical protein MSH58_12875 [Clostridiales bacterium]|nr:hypothetical protein [Clostridiales bacterium]
MIKFLVTGQQLKIVTPIVVADTHNYQTASAVFRGSEWEPCSKWAHFIKDGVTYDVPFHSDEITADQSLDLTAGTWQVYIHGNAYDADTDTVTTRITTNTAYLKVEAAEMESPFPSVTPSFSETLAAEIENALQVASGVRQDAASGAFNGATFKPAVSASGDLSWTNDKGLPNPNSVNIKGAPGDPGDDFRILGYYESLGVLTDTVTGPSPGDAYGVGSEQPYDIYIWDAVGNQWVNNGPVQGAKGDPGDDATIEIGTVTTVNPDQPASVENVGTPSAAKFNFSIPKGYTPKKGTDYWTEADKQAIGESITPSMIGAVADPSQKSDGQVLAYDKETGKWVAVNMTSGVSSVDGKSGAVVTRLMFVNQTIAANSFMLQASPKYADFPYVASKALSGVTAEMAPFVVFSPSDATSGNFCPVVDAYSGGIYIYAHSAPSSAITIPFILCMAGQGTLTGMSNSNGFLATVLSFTSKTVAVSDWASDTTYTDFPYRAAVACEGVTANHYAAVVFSPTDALEGIFCPVVESYDGGVYLYANEMPSAAVTIPTIVCTPVE